MTDDHPGLAHDLAALVVLLNRRRVLGMLMASACLPLAGCSGKVADTSGNGGSDGGATGDGGAAGDGGRAGDGGSDACTRIPEETAGPFPGDGTNGPNVLDQPDIVRSDMRSSLGKGGAVAQGVPLSLRLRVVDSAAGCTPLVGYAIYAWHCDRDGLYSLYTAPDESYLRAVQITDKDGTVDFSTIFPGCYPGRWPHVHFEIYASEKAARGGVAPVAVSQLALPEAACKEAYVEVGYQQASKNLGRISLETDSVFRDGWKDQLAEVSGSPGKAFQATLQVGIAAPLAAGGFTRSVGSADQPCRLAYAMSVQWCSEHFPGPPVLAQSSCEVPQLVRIVDPKARHQPVPQHEQRKYWDHQCPEQPTPAEGPQPRQREGEEQGRETHAHQVRRVPRHDLDDDDGTPLSHSIRQDGTRRGRGQVVEGVEHQPRTGQVFGYGHRIDRGVDDIDEVGVRGLERRPSLSGRVQVGERHAQARDVTRQIGQQCDQWSARTGTQVHQLGLSTALEHGAKRLGQCVHLARRPRHEGQVGGAGIAPCTWEPGLVFEFDEVQARHVSIYDAGGWPGT